VVTVGVEQGIIVAIVASLIDHLRRSYHPPTAVLQQSGTAGAWHSTEAVPDARSLPGLVVYRFAGSLYYANANMFFEQASAFATSPDPPSWLCLDAAAMPDIDYSGGETIRQLYGELHDHGIKLVMADPMPAVARTLDRYGLTDLLGADAIYPTVLDAVDAFRQQPSRSGD
jgi:SulP family sulfate permease